jgi:prepilin-type N-terminal cleavage/methylation domain-containing protein
MSTFIYIKQSTRNKILVFSCLRTAAVCATNEKNILPSEKKYSNNIPGFTLVEILVAMLLGLIVTAAVFFYYNTLNSSGISQREISAIQNDLVAVTEAMEMDLMNAGCNPKTTSSFSGYNGVYYKYSGPGSIMVNSDLDKNGVYSGDNRPASYSENERIVYRINKATQTLERIYYEYNGSTYVKTVIQPILKNVTNFNITYWSTTLNQYATPSSEVTYPATLPSGWTVPASDTTLASADAAKVKAVIVKITVRTDKKDPHTGQYIERSAEKWIDMRNR